jgi:hypothetical protein
MLVHIFGQQRIESVRTSHLGNNVTATQARCFQRLGRVRCTQARRESRGISFCGSRHGSRNERCLLSVRNLGSACIRINILIEEVLRNPEYRQNAYQMKHVIAATNELEKSVDLLELAFRLA